MLPLSVKQVKLLYQCENAYYSSKCFCNFDFASVLDMTLTLLWCWCLSCRNQSIDLRSKFFPAISCFISAICCFYETTLFSAGYCHKIRFLIRTSNASLEGEKHSVHIRLGEMQSNEKRHGLLVVSCERIWPRNILVSIM